MGTLTIIILIINALTLVIVYLLFSKKSEVVLDNRIDLILSNQNRLEGSLKQDFQTQVSVINNIEKEIS